MQGRSGTIKGKGPGTITIKMPKGAGKLRAKDFGDNPNVRRSHGEHKRFDPREPWEVDYRIRTGQLRPIKKK